MSRELTLSSQEGQGDDFAEPTTSRELASVRQLLTDSLASKISGPTWEAPNLAI